MKAVRYFINRWILCRRHLQVRAQPFDLELKVCAADVIGRHLYKHGSHDAQITGFLRRHLHIEPGDVLFDVGANIGWYSLVFDRMAPDGVDIFAFEPEPANFALLEENLARNDANKVHAIRKGVSDREETRKLHLYGKGNQGRHSLLPINDSGTIDVPVVPLDTFWAERHLGDRPVRLLKIDVEGYEYIALKGAGAVLGRCCAVLTEFAPGYMKKAGLEPMRMLQLLRGCGFTPNFMRGEEKVVADTGELARSERRVNLYWEKNPLAKAV
ncbi:MAG TPA: FkbM family methyltransferase [Gammaproteobacteria bacterium]|nr:FkbM family methyltransferase [Gammaproteobacteria bacterium]